MQTAYQLPTQSTNWDPLSEQAFQGLTQAADQKVANIADNKKQQTSFMLSSINQTNASTQIVQDFENLLDKLSHLVKGSSKISTQPDEDITSIVEQLKRKEDALANKTNSKENNLDNNLQDTTLLNAHEHEQETLKKMHELREQRAEQLEQDNKQGLVTSNNYEQARLYFDDAKQQNSLKQEAQDQAKQLAAEENKDTLNLGNNQNKDSNPSQSNNKNQPVFSTSKPSSPSMGMKL